jgi:cyclophilin family peptidyl-prolyl cis-trans isomerase
VKAARLVKERSWDSALAVLADLEARFPKHFLCATSEHPPQYQEEVEHEGKEKDDSTAAKDAPPELVTPTPGSAVGLLRAQIEREKQFEAAHSAFYMPPDPDAKPTVVVKLSTDEEFKIRFYKDQAPKHVESFLAKVRDGWYTNQCIDQVQRKPAQGAPETWVEQMHFGLAASTSDDRSTWATARTKPSDTQIEFEDNDLSHFSGMVAAAKDPDSKSSGERVWVTANDCAAQEDGTRVIFGRVVEGLDVVQRICRDSSFVDEAMANRGQGQLQNYIRITSMEILDDEPPAKGSNGEGGGTPESGGANKTGGR